MNPENHTAQDELDPFAEPRTIPSGWNHSALNAPRPATTVEDSWRSEKFEEPRTIPHHWDVENLR